MNEKVYLIEYSKDTSSVSIEVTVPGVYNLTQIRESGFDVLMETVKNINGWCLKDFWEIT